MAALAEVSRHAYCARFAYPAAYLNPRRHQLVGAALQYLLAQQGGAQIFALQILAFYSRCGCGWGADHPIACRVPHGVVSENGK